MSDKRSRLKSLLPVIPATPVREIGQTGFRSDPKLIAAGWVRRHLVDKERSKESVELYASIGYEVRVQQLTPDDFGSDCIQCAADVCRSYVIIYTRKQK